MTLYLANMWDGLLGDRGLKLLAGTFGEVKGNWLTPPRHAPRPGYRDYVLLAPSTMESAITPAAAAATASVVVSWVLFPDQVIGWDWQRHTYQYNVAPVLSDAIVFSQTVAVNSGYTAKNLQRSGISTHLTVLPLGVDVMGIKAAADAGSGRDRVGVHVLWAHMWRSQKDPQTALRVAAKVLELDPAIRITIGRSESWLDEQHSPPGFQRRVLALADRLRQTGKGRVRFLEHVSSQSNYWRMLSNVDISYSCSLEESFGVAMLEHAAAGAACVCPNTLCYPETQQNAVLVQPKEADLVNAICVLAADPTTLDKVRAECRRQAARYPIETTIRGITRLFGIE